MVIQREQTQNGVNRPNPPSDRKSEFGGLANRPRATLDWAIETFGDVANDPRERTMRFIEEALELVHALDIDHVTLQAIIKRVWGRDKGYIPREVGQALMTLEALAECIGHCADREATQEFDRVRAIPVEEWTRRHSAKQAIGIAAPTPRSSMGGEK